MERHVNLHAIMPRSRANGPGVRMVIWFQGCTRNCPGCFNPATHSHDPRVVMSVDELIARIKAEAAGTEGVTISGGEPLEQKEALVELLTRVRRDGDLSVVLFTGWTWEEIESLPERDALLSCVDVLIAGPYEAEQHVAEGLVGSANQTVHFLTDRYSWCDLAQPPEGEIVIRPDGAVMTTGIDPVLAVEGQTDARGC